MAITITWSDGVDPLTAFTIPNDVQASLDSYRNAQLTPSSSGPVPAFASIQSMMVGIFMQTMISPALSQYPTPTLTAAQVTANNAAAALATAQQNAVPNFAALGPATTLAAFSGNAQTGAVGAALSAPLVVVATDANGNPIAGVSVAFAVAAGAGTLSTASAVTGTNGQASTTLTLGAVAGTNSVTATSGTLSGSPVAFTATGH